MKKLLIFIILIIAGMPLTALAEMKGYLGTDGYFHIQGLEPNTKYTIDLGGMPLIRAGNSNSCGILRIASSGTIKASDRIEIKDEKSGSTYGFTNTNIPVKETAKCDGTVKPEREIWNDDKGTTYISGLSPSSAQTIRLLTSAPTRNIRANICGFLSFKLDNPRPSAIIIENQAFVLSGLQSGGGIACRKGKLFVAYPAPVFASAVSAVTWRSQNPISWLSGAQIASTSGGGTSWSPPPNPNPGGSGSSATCPTGTTGTPPNCITPPPPTCPTGTTGTPPNCVTPPPPPVEPPTTCPTGTTGTPPNCITPPPQTCPTGTTGTPPNCVTLPPRPPYGRYCKTNEAGLLIIGLTPNKKHTFYGAEQSNYRQATSSESGKVILTGINFFSRYEDSSSGLDIIEGFNVVDTIYELDNVPSCIY